MAQLLDKLKLNFEFHHKFFFITAIESIGATSAAMYKLSNLSKKEVKERKERQRQRKEERKSTSTASTSRHVPFTPLCSKEEAWGGGGASNLPEPTISEAIYDPNFIRGTGRRFKCMIKDPWELVLMKTIEYEEHQLPWIFDHAFESSTSAPYEIGTLDDDSNA